MRDDLISRVCRAEETLAPGAVGSGGERGVEHAADARPGQWHAMSRAADEAKLGACGWIEDCQELFVAVVVGVKIGDECGVRVRELALSEGRVQHFDHNTADTSAMSR